MGLNSRCGGVRCMPAFLHGCARADLEGGFQRYLFCLKCLDQTGHDPGQRFVTLANGGPKARQRLCGSK